MIRSKADAYLDFSRLSIKSDFGGRKVFKDLKQPKETARRNVFKSKIVQGLNVDCSHDPDVAISLSSKLETPSLHLITGIFGGVSVLGSIIPEQEVLERFNGQRGGLWTDYQSTEEVRTSIQAVNYSNQFCHRICRCYIISQCLYFSVRSPYIV